MIIVFLLINNNPVFARAPPGQKSESIWVFVVKKLDSAAGSPCFGEHLSGKQTFLLDKKRHFNAEWLQIFTHASPQERKYNGEGHASLGGPHHFGEKQCNGVVVSEVIVILSY